MLHPSYTDLMEVVNSEVEPGEAPVVNSRYSIVLATAKRARQLISGAEPLIDSVNADDKPLSIAIAEVHKGETKILSEEEAAEYALNVANSFAEPEEVIAESEEIEAEDDNEEADSSDEE